MSEWVEDGDKGLPWRYKVNNGDCRMYSVFGAPQNRVRYIVMSFCLTCHWWLLKWRWKLDFLIHLKCWPIVLLILWLEVWVCSKALALMDDTLFISSGQNGFLAFLQAWFCSHSSPSCSLYLYLPCILPHSQTPSQESSLQPPPHPALHRSRSTKAGQKFWVYWLCVTLDNMVDSRWLQIPCHPLFLGGDAAASLSWLILTHRIWWTWHCASSGPSP